MPDDLLKSFKTSGNNFHVGIVKRFREAGWTVRVSPYYVDSYTDKPREIDLVAEKEYSYRHPGVLDPFSVFIRLFVECKYLPIGSNQLFWFDRRDDAMAEHMLGQRRGFTPNHHTIKNHHYFKDGDQVAKLFSSAKGQGEQEPIYKGLTQCLNATIALRDSEPMARETGLPVLGLLYMPVIVFSSLDDCYMVDFDDDLDNGDEPRRVDNIFQLEVTYAHSSDRGKTEEEHFLVDCFEAGALDEYLKKLEEDAYQLQQCVEYTRYP